MITQSILNWFSDVLASLTGVIPSLDEGLAGRLDALPGQIDTVAGSASRLGPVFPFDAVSTCLSIVAAGFVAGFAIFLVLKVLSYVTGGGGAL